MDSIEAFRKNLRKLIDSGEITILGLKEKTGISRASIYGWMDGSNVPNLEQVQRVAGAVGRKSSDMLKGEIPPASPLPAPRDPNPEEMAEAILSALNLPEVRLRCIRAILKLNPTGLIEIADNLEDLLPRDAKVDKRKRGTVS
jgi:hypothetical protein